MQTPQWEQGQSFGWAVNREQGWKQQKQVQQAGQGQIRWRRQYQESPKCWKSLLAHRIALLRRYQSLRHASSWRWVHRHPPKVVCHPAS